MLKGLTISVRARPGLPEREKRAVKHAAGQPKPLSLQVGGSSASTPLELHGRLHTGRPGSRPAVLLTEYPKPANNNQPPFLDDTAESLGETKEHPKLHFHVPVVMPLPLSPSESPLPSTKSHGVPMGAALDLTAGYAMQSAPKEEREREREVDDSTVESSPQVTVTSPPQMRAPQVKKEDAEPTSHHDGYVGTIAAQLTDAMRLNLEKSERARQKVFQREKEMEALTLGSQGMVLRARNSAPPSVAPVAPIVPASIRVPGAVPRSLRASLGQLGEQSFEDSGEDETILQDTREGNPAHAPSSSTDRPRTATPCEFAAQTRAESPSNAAGPIPTVSVEATQRTLLPLKKADRPPSIAPRDSLCPAPSLAVTGKLTGQVNLCAPSPTKPVVAIKPRAASPATAIIVVPRSETPLETIVRPPTPAQRDFAHLPPADVPLLLTEQMALTERTELSDTCSPVHSIVVQSTVVNLAMNVSGSKNHSLHSPHSPRATYPLTPVPLLLYPFERAGDADANAWGGAVSFDDRVDGNVAMAMAGLENLGIYQGGDHYEAAGGDVHKALSTRKGMFRKAFVMPGEHNVNEEGDLPTTHTTIAGAGFRAVALGRGPLWGGEVEEDNIDASGRLPLHFPIIRRPLPLKTVPPKLLNIAIMRHARALNNRKRREQEMQREQEREAKRRLHLFAKLHLQRDDLPYEVERRVAEEGHVVFSPRLESDGKPFTVRETGGRWSAEGTHISGKYPSSSGPPRLQGVVYIPHDNDDASLASLQSGFSLGGGGGGGLFASVHLQERHTHLTRRVEEQMRRYQDIQRWSQLQHAGSESLFEPGHDSEPPQWPSEEYEKNLDNKLFRLVMEDDEEERLDGRDIEWSRWAGQRPEHVDTGATGHCEVQTGVPRLRAEDVVVVPVDAATISSTAVLASRAMTYSARPRSAVAAAQSSNAPARPLSGTAHSLAARATAENAGASKPFPTLFQPPALVINALPRGRPLSTNPRDVLPHPMDMHPQSARWYSHSLSPPSLSLSLYIYSLSSLFHSTLPSSLSPFPSLLRQ